MDDQISLPGFGGAKPPFKPEVVSRRGRSATHYSLFLAIVPQSVDAQRLGPLATALRRQHDLGGKQLQPEHLHITLHEFKDFDRTFAQEVVDAAVAAAASVVCPPLPIVFDRACSFNNLRSEKSAFVLRCDAPSDLRVAKLRQALSVVLRGAGLDPKPSSTPHMTMLYDQRIIPEHPIEPIRWTATRFALILSHVGVGHHQWIGCWDLVDRP